MVSPVFTLMCVLHSTIALTSGALMILGIASKLQGTTPHDQVLIDTSESFSGLMLFTIGFLLLMVAFVKDREFQSFFAKGCVMIHISMAVWRFFFQRKLGDLAHDWLRHAVGDIALAISWLFFLVYTWREKYD